jgi:hypothetical protein
MFPVMTGTVDSWTDHIRFVRQPRMEFVVRTLKLITLTAVVSALLLTVSPVQAIENVKGKPYHLTPKHGPWMVMVTSFRNIRDRDLKTDGLTAEEAAAELVYELRNAGIPAYAYSQDAIKGEIDVTNRLGREDHRIYAAQRDMICVLAGNYESIEDKVGQKTLAYIKRFQPKFLKDPKNGAILRPDAAQRGPLAGAFMTINPLLKPDEVVQRHVDKETKYLNSGIQYPLVKNPHKYTVRVATFEGKSATPLGNSSFRGRESLFDAKLRNPMGLNLDRAGVDAANLAAFLRTTKAKLKGQFGNSGIDEAYVFHDKFQSIVTIGGFDSPDDPRIRMIARYYGPKLVPDTSLLSATKFTPEARASVTDEELDRLPKIITTHTEQLLPDNADPNALPLQIWTFDTEPKVIPVPQIK